MVLIKVNKFIIYILLLSSSLAGCTTSVDKRPDTWSESKQVDPEKCPDISGTYKNIGYSSDKDACVNAGNGQIVSFCVLHIALSQPFHTLPYTIPATDLLATKIDIGTTQDDGIIPITVLRNDKVIKEYMLGDEKNRYECKGGALVKPVVDASRSTYASTSYRGGQYYKPSTDGSLILELDIKAYGMVLVIPTTGHARVWFQWERVSNY
jgi:hypothetical protein